MKIWTVVSFALLVLAKPQAPVPAQNSSGTSPAGTHSTPPGTPPVPPPATSSPTASPAPAPKGPICECGYTYCASVLKAMKTPWGTKELTDAYCTTPHATCPNGKPSTDVNNAVYICLCNEVDQKVGTDLDLMCGCDKCLNTGPDFRGRCETPCYPAGHK